ncbi:hypothetical protein Y032_0463g1911 [Ancylostoma ceylanicum]|nr:hypothetical protein Y032_0463g1911 [Ancylostoma ceylanicum]
MIVVDKLIAVALPLKHKVWPNSLYTFSMCLPPLLIASGALFASYYSVNDVEINVCRPPTFSYPQRVARPTSVLHDAHGLFIPSVPQQIPGNGLFAGNALNSSCSKPGIYKSM